MWVEGSIPSSLSILKDYIMEYTDEDYRDITWGDHEDFKNMVPASIVDTSRWSVFYELIVQRISDQKFFNLSWVAPSTEYQKCDPEYVMYEVVPVEKLVTVYETKQ